jgi:hypothetical protein
MSFSRSPAFSIVEESFSASAGYNDTMAGFISDTDSNMLQFGVSPPALAHGWEDNATIDPALLLTQHQDLENFPNNATPSQQS